MDRWTLVAPRRALLAGQAVGGRAPLAGGAGVSVSCSHRKAMSRHTARRDQTGWQAGQPSRQTDGTRRTDGRTGIHTAAAVNGMVVSPTRGALSLLPLQDHGLPVSFLSGGKGGERRGGAREGTGLHEDNGLCAPFIQTYGHVWLPLPGQYATVSRLPGRAQGTAVRGQP